MLSKQVVLTVAVALLMSAWVVVAMPQTSIERVPTKDRPIIEVDLHKLSDGNWSPNNGDKSGTTLRSAVYFADGTTLVWSWLTRDDFGPRVKDLSHPPVSFPRGAMHIHAVVLDAFSGEARAKNDWSVPSSEVYYGVAQDGDFLTCVDNKIRLFSAEFEFLREVELASPVECTRLAALGSSGISPSRRLILASDISAGKNISEMLDTRTLKPVSSANEDRLVTITAFSDHWLAGQCGDPWEICIRKMDGLWKAFSFTGPENQPPTRVLGRAYFVNDDTLLICRPNDLTVANVDGSVLFRVNLPKDRSCDNNRPALSSDGQRFAIMESRRLPMNEFFDMGLFWTDDRILVFDGFARRAIFAVKVEGASQWPSTRTHTNAFSLSPDGSRLAVVSDGVLRIYKLPARSAAH